MTLASPRPDLDRWPGGWQHNLFNGPAGQEVSARHTVTGQGQTSALLYTKIDAGYRNVA
jgi:hypothetical protein